MNGETIEVVKYTEAEWAPRLGTGEFFDWAIRVTSSTGNQMTTVCNGTKAQAKTKARRYLLRLRKQFNGEITHHTRAQTSLERAREKVNQRRAEAEFL